MHKWKYGGNYDAGFYYSDHKVRDYGGGDSQPSNSKTKIFAQFSQLEVDLPDAPSRTIYKLILFSSFNLNDLIISATECKPAKTALSSGKEVCFAANDIWQNQYYDNYEAHDEYCQSKGYDGMADQLSTQDINDLQVLWNGEFRAFFFRQEKKITKSFQI